MRTRNLWIGALSLALISSPLWAQDNNQTIEGQCGQKTGGGWEGAGFWANWAYYTCQAMGGDYFIGAAQEIGKFYDEEFGEVTVYKNPKNQKEYYVHKTKNGQYHLGRGLHFMIVPPPPAGKLFLPDELVNAQPGPNLSLAELKARQEAAQRAKLLQSARQKIKL